MVQCSERRSAPVLGFALALGLVLHGRRLQQLGHGAGVVGLGCAGANGAQVLVDVLNLVTQAGPEAHTENGGGYLDGRLVLAAGCRLVVEGADVKDTHAQVARAEVLLGEEEVTCHVLGAELGAEVVREGRGGERVVRAERVDAVLVAENLHRVGCLAKLRGEHLDDVTLEDCALVLGEHEGCELGRHSVEIVAPVVISDPPAVVVARALQLHEAALGPVREAGVHHGGQLGRCEGKVRDAERHSARERPDVERGGHLRIHAEYVGVAHRVPRLSLLLPGGCGLARRPLIAIARGRARARGRGDGACRRKHAVQRPPPLLAKAVGGDWEAHAHLPLLHRRGSNATRGNGGSGRRGCGRRGCGGQKCSCGEQLACSACVHGNVEVVAAADVGGRAEAGGERLCSHRGAVAGHHNILGTDVAVVDVSVVRVATHDLCSLLVRRQQPAEVELVVMKECLQASGVEVVAGHGASVE
mmetsp:Transcript_17129/g.66699  ORF Transcript_17129/g.66699 Transcript_17129/m.66699 type:complete len:472 (+) Transcript_17129:95-1510(+)